MPEIVDDTCTSHKSVPLSKLKDDMNNRPLRHHPVHIIYRLYGSLPTALLSELRQEYKEALNELTYGYTAQDLKDDRIYQLYLREKRDLQDQFEERYDQLLDQIDEGPKFLNDPFLQKVLIDSWCKMQQMNWVTLYAVSVMPNHVHVMISHPDEDGISPLEPLMEKHKRFTGREINKYLGRTGVRVWEPQVFDRDVRPNKWGTVFWYILNNPVKAGLCENYEEWPGNYWHPDWV